MTTPMEIRREVQFAVVMYGGVSLAIYINGVAQELMKMVRATAPNPEDKSTALFDWDDLEESEQVYRRLGQLLGREGDELTTPWNKNDPIHTRFVIDILSGTSAGGINAVFLAKAIANDENLTTLEKLWLEQGDILQLINDKESTRDLPGLKTTGEPKSLLNGERMYRLLLDALAGMKHNSGREGDTKSPYANELELFVTTTDIHGLPVDLPVGGCGATEKRHRTVFHFAYNQEPGREQNDFTADNDVFLAFASRCTSSFPFAFEPSRLLDIDPILAATPGRQASEGSKNAHWQRFFPTYSSAGVDYAGRAFGDGGYLDNKPFSYAIDALGLHSTGIPVDRKLIYIEPKPAGEDSATEANPPPPNAIQNVAAALGLPRYESIREDLEHVIERNRLISRVDDILSGIEADVWSARPQGMSAKDYIDQCKSTWQEFVASNRLEDQQQFGVQYAGYERLEIAATTDDLTQWIARAGHLDVGSDTFVALQYLVRAWRDHAYPAEPTQEDRDQQRTLRHFLYHFNLRYRLQRLNFVIGRIDRLHILGPYADQMLQLQFGVSLNDMGGKERGRFRAELERIRQGLTQSLEMRARNRQELGAPPQDHWLGPLARVLLDAFADPKGLLAESGEEDRRNRAHALVTGPCEQAFDDLARTARENLSMVGRKAAALDKQARVPRADDDQWTRMAREIVDGFWEMFTYYDVIIFPILHATECGELTQPIEIIRVSPEDATALIAEKKAGRQKLAGTVLMNFGGFLERSWRWNDMLWGKLDAVERLVTVLLPGNNDAQRRSELIRDAHTVRIHKAFSAQDKQRVSSDLIERAVADAKSTGGGENNDTLDQDVEAVVRQAMDKEQLYSHFADNYEVRRSPNPESALRSLARGTQVVGKMLEGISGDYGVNEAPAQWLTRIGRWFWGLVEVAVPRSIYGFIVRYWIRVLYLFGIVLTAGGALFANWTTVRIGLITVGATLSIHTIVMLLSDAIRGRRRVVTTLKTVVILLVLGLLGLGIWHVPELMDATVMWIETHLP